MALKRVTGMMRELRNALSGLAAFRTFAGAADATAAKARIHLGAAPDPKTLRDGGAGLCTIELPEGLAGEKQVGDSTGNFDVSGEMAIVLEKKVNATAVAAAMAAAATGEPEALEDFAAIMLFADEVDGVLEELERERQAADWWWMGSWRMTHFGRPAKEDVASVGDYFLARFVLSLGVDE